MKKNIVKIFALILTLSLCFTFTSCELLNVVLEKIPGFGQGQQPPVGGEEEEEDLPDELAGITEDTIWVGNTAGVTGYLATIGAPFNLGIQAAFAAYNAAGGYNGKSVKLKHYNDEGLATNSVPMLEKLIHEDEVFAIVGHFGSYAVDATLETLIDEEVPMIYAAAGNDALLNENADTLGEKGIVPVQPLNKTEGRMLILRAFAPADKGGLAATKVGVISNSNEASKSLLAGIKDEAENLPESKKNNIVYQEVATADYSAAVNALKAAGCDVVVLTVIGADFTSCLKTMANSAYNCKVLTSYNNASATVFNDKNGTLMLPEYEAVFSTMAIYTQAWLDISSATYVYNNVEHPLGQAYKAAYDAYGLPFPGVAGFTEDYWRVAENIYSYALTVDPTNALAMSADSYALAGYIAGDLFCQALEALEASGKALSRKNLIAVLESQEYQIAMADALSFANGMRAGVQSFALTQFYDDILVNGQYHKAASATVHGLMSLDDYRALLGE